MPAARLARNLGRALARAVRAEGPRGGTGYRGDGGRRDPADDYPGDFAGVVRPVYAPDLDGEADPGEVVWTWVPYEEDHTRGKDRPVLVVGHDGPWLLALMLTSRDHDAQPGRKGETWLDIGSGPWDARRRPSEVRLDRVLRVRPDGIRREGAVLDRERFDQVAGSLARERGW